MAYNNIIYILYVHCTSIRICTIHVRAFMRFFLVMHIFFAPRQRKLNRLWQELRNVYEKYTWTIVRLINERPLIPAKKLFGKFFFRMYIYFVLSNADPPWPHLHALWICEMRVFEEQVFVFIRDFFFREMKFSLLS